MNNNETQKIIVDAGRDESITNIITSVYISLKEKGYNPVSQMVGYILSGDPTYITSHNNARALIGKVERDELLEVLVKKFVNE